MRCGSPCTKPPHLPSNFHRRDPNILSVAADRPTAQLTVTKKLHAGHDEADEDVIPVGSGAGIQAHYGQAPSLEAARARSPNGNKIVGVQPRERLVRKPCKSSRLATNELPLSF